MAGKIVADTLEHSTAGSIATNYVVEGSAKEWINLNGTGTIAVRDSFNVASITDNGTGIYRVNLSNSMSGNDNMSPNCNCEEAAGGYNRSATSSTTSTSYSDVRTFNVGTYVLFDALYVYHSMDGDLA